MYKVFLFVLIMISISFSQSYHSDSKTTSIHTPFRWIWADSAARVAQATIKRDTTKLGFQVDDYSVWYLYDTLPTWYRVGTYKSDSLLIGGILIKPNTITGVDSIAATIVNTRQLVGNLKVEGDSVEISPSAGETWYELMEEFTLMPRNMGANFAKENNILNIAAISTGNPAAGISYTTIDTSDSSAGNWYVGQEGDDRSNGFAFRWDRHGSLFTSENNTLKFLIDTSGNVGIGTDSPDGTLHVYTASAGAVTPSTTADELVVEGVSAGMSLLTTDGTWSRLFFGSPSDNDAGRVQWNYDQSNFVVGTNTANASVSLTSGAGIIALTIDDVGNVGVGIDTPQTELHVVAGYAHLPSVSSSTVGLFQNNSTTGTSALISVLSGNTGVSQVNFGDTDDEDIGHVRYDHDNDWFEWKVNGTNQVMVLSSGGNLTTTADANVGGNVDITGGLQFDSGDLMTVYDTGSFSCSLFDATTYRASVTAKYSIQGIEAIIRIPTVQGTLSGVLALLKTIPSSLQPVTSQAVSTTLHENGSNIPGICVIGNSGIITLLNVDGTNLSAGNGGTFSIYDIVLKYLLQ